jgi:hypothetical protein
MTEFEQRITDIRAREQAAKEACPGRWAAESCPVNGGRDVYWGVSYGGEEPCERYDVFDRGVEPIARFVEGAVYDIPWLLEQIERLTGENQEMRLSLHLSQLTNRLMGTNR